MREETAAPTDPPTSEEQELSGEEEQASPPGPPRVVVPRWVQIVLLPLALLALWALARASGKVLLLFVVAGVIALILNPAVSFLQRSRLPRGLAVLAVYLAFFLTLTGIGFLLANPISNQVRSFSHNLPHLVNEGNTTINNVQNYLNDHGVHVQLVKQGKTALQTLQDKVSKSSELAGLLRRGPAHRSRLGLLRRGAGLRAVGVHAALRPAHRRARAPGDARRRRHARRRLPHAGAARRLALRRRAAAVQLRDGHHARASALYIFGVLGIFPDGEKYAVAFGVFYGVMELVPYIGPILGALPPILVALFTDPISALWVGLLFIGLQQLEGHVVAPQIFGAHAAHQPAAGDLRAAARACSCTA